MMTVAVENIFTRIRQIQAAEEFITLLENPMLKIERIVSCSHSSPAGFWYDEADDEWVIVLRGDARLEFFGGETVEMHEGDYLTIPRHVKHRVARTGPETVWLAIHIK
jgi:cupin 2 domain-containing protein